MRLRYVEGATDLINSNPELIINNKDNKIIDFDSLFKNNEPIHIEIGMGKGKFIYELAEMNPNINYIGIERFDSVIVRALEKVLEKPLNNLMLLRTDAIDLTTIFTSGSISRIYLNFSDPWPKPRHVKRRLTNKKFLKMYQSLMIKESEIYFKTDNIDLFEFSVEEITDYPMEITYLTRDLHNSDYKNNIMTEFEDKFSKRGNKINMLIAIFKEDIHG